MEAQLELARLFAGVLAGDAFAREQLFLRYEYRLRCTLWTFARDARYSHSDMVQSAFCHLFEDAQAGKIRLQSDHEVIGLLVRYAHNRARTGLRKERIAQRHATLYAHTRQRAQLPPGYALEAADLVDYMGKRLTPTAAQIVELKNKDVSFQQIALQVNKSLAAVEKIYYRAINHLNDLARQQQLV